MAELMDQPNREAVGLEPVAAGSNDPGAEPKAKAAKDEPVVLPGQHAGLDEFAAEHNHEWSSDDLTVAEKKAELEEAGYA